MFIQILWYDACFSNVCYQYGSNDEDGDITPEDLEFEEGHGFNDAEPNNNIDEVRCVWLKYFASY